MNNIILNKQDLIFDTSKQNIFFTSDTHFGHKNILKYCGRPFTDVDEMNEELIRRWNSVVKPNDIVFHLGDVMMNCSVSKTIDILKRLNGIKYWIFGNHDYEFLFKTAIQEQFHYMSPKMRIRVNGQLIILNHEPLLCYEGSYDENGHKSWQLFGHVHSGETQTTGLDIERLAVCFPTQYDVGVDNNNYTPISFDEVKLKIEAQVEKYNQAQ